MPHWRDLAVCKEIDPELFYPEMGQASAAAKYVCKKLCEVRDECGQNAMDEERGLGPRYRHGIWGGMSPKERYQRDKRESGRDFRYTVPLGMPGVA